MVKKHLKLALTLKSNIKRSISLLLRGRRTITLLRGKTNLWLTWKLTIKYEQNGYGQVRQAWH